MSNLDHLLIYRAKIAEQAERYDDMVEIMKEVASSGPLGSEERNMLSVAYKNVIGARRSSWRVVKAIDSTKNDNQESLCQDYAKKIETELDGICANVNKFLDEIVIPQASNDTESLVFYYKMKGDYCRYRAEYSKNDQDGDESEAAYKKATEIAEKMESTNPIKLGLALNFSVFYYEIRQQPELACKTAKEAFDLAITELDHMTEKDYKDSTLIMQLLRDNLTLWTSDIAGESEQQD